MPGQPPPRGRPARGVAPAPRPPGTDRASWQRVVADGLEAHGYVTARRGQDRVEFRCPAHEDRKPSGTADYDAAGERTLICCHQGCDTADVLAAIGLQLRDLYDHPGERTDEPAPIPRQARPRKAVARPKTAPAPEEPKCDHDWQPDSEHPYRRAVIQHGEVIEGELANTVIRKRCARCGVKDVRPLRAWPEPERILYRLPEVLQAIIDGATVWIHEGEKCADALAALGHASTTNPFGAGKWLNSYTTALLGAALVVIVADNDAAGYRHAMDIAARLEAAGIPCEVVRAATDAVKADIADHLEQGGTLATLIPCDPGAELARLETNALRALTRHLAAQRAAGTATVTAKELTKVMAREGMDRPWISAQLRAAVRRGELADGEDDGTYQLLPGRRSLELAAAVQVPAGQRIPVDPLQLPPDLSLLDARRFDPGDWPHVVPGLLPVGLVLIYGRPGVAKTTLSAQLEHCIAAGLPVAGYQPEAAGRCMVIDYEGGPMLAIGQSLRIAPFGSLATDDDGDPDEMISVRTAWPGDAFTERYTELEKALRDAAHDGRPYRFVRIDTMRAFMGAPPLGYNAYQWDAECLIRLNQLARDMGCAIVVIHHPNKQGEVSGSVGIEGSCTTAYKLERKAGESEGVLRCTKNRVGPETSWAVEFDTRAGTWQFSDEITAAQAANTGVKRAIIDHLTGTGPAAGPDIRAALVPARDRTVRDMLTRLAHDGWITRTPEGLWMLTPSPIPAPQRAAAARDDSPSAPSGPAAASPQPADQRRPARRPPVATCAACRTPMTVLTPGQRYHPLCEPDPAPPPAAPAAPGQGSGAGAPEPPPPDDEPGSDPDPFDGSDPDTCPVCGEPVTNADRHPDCDPATGTGARWGGMSVMREALQTSRMKPVPWIPPPGHPAAKAGMQTRDLPQWRTAEQVDTGAFAWRLPALDDVDGGRLVLTIDRNMSYPSACSSVPLAPNTLKPVTLDGDPKAAGLAGVTRIIVPEWPRADLPHPLGRNARPGEQLVIPSGSLEELWALHRAGLIAEPEVTDAFMGRRNTSLFEPFYKTVKAARAEHAGNQAMTLAIKRSSSIAVRLLYPKAAKSPWWRPDWYGALVGQAMIRHWIRARQAVDNGAVLIGLGSVDEAAYLVPEDADPASWLPAPYQRGTGPGQVKDKPITVRRDTGGLDTIDAARIGPSPRGPDFAEVSGPVPLSIWRQRHG